MLDAVIGVTDRMEQAHEALAIAREVDDPALLARALTACGCIDVYNIERSPGRTSPRRAASPGR
jgi:hypothetical protein